MSLGKEARLSVPFSVTFFLGTTLMYQDLNEDAGFCSSNGTCLQLRTLKVTFKLGLASRKKQKKFCSDAYLHTGQLPSEIMDINKRARARNNMTVWLRW